MKRNQVMANLTDQQFEAAVKACSSYAAICRRIGLRAQGSNYNTLRRRIERQKIVIELRPNRAARVYRPTCEMLVKDSDVSSNDLRRRLIKEGVLLNQCIKCGLSSEWQGEPITLNLDHENGDHRDNRLFNLRILCPNCHSQTPTHSGKRLKGRKLVAEKSPVLCVCGKTVSKNHVRCASCAQKDRAKAADPNKVELTVELLNELIWSEPLTKVASKVGYTGSGIHAACKRLGVALPPPGYWARRNAGQSHEHAVLPPPEPTYSKLSSTETNLIDTLAAGGAGPREIGRRIGRNHTTISRYLKR